MIEGAIKKNGIQLRTLEDWRHLAGPKRSGHWKDDRSAKENARRWLDAAPHLPSEIAELLSRANIRPIGSWFAEPEARVNFDDLGEPANVDMLVNAEDDIGPIVICIEAKVDETFGETLEKTLSNAQQRLKKSPASKGVMRIERLASTFRLDLSRPDIQQLRYQLLTLTAATIAEARRQSAYRAIAVIHEFVTPLANDRYRDRNARDLGEFLRIFPGDTNSLREGMLTGPIRTGGVGQLHFGKVTWNTSS